MFLSPIDLYLRLNQAIWRRLPERVRDSRPASWYGGILHRLVCQRARRRQYFGTFFLRNRPLLEQMRRLMEARPDHAAVDVAVLGCSSGAEVYSIAWTVRSARPDLQLRLRALDISPDIIAVAEKGEYTSESSELVGRSIFERMTRAELESLFDWSGERATVKRWIREGISWQVADAGDPDLVPALRPQDIVVASNFLCHMDPVAAERCLRNIARLVKPGGHLFVVGVDLEIRTRIARELGWHPIPDLIREIHDGDPSVRRDWPWAWWGLEPLNDRKSDWRLRYAVAYRV